MRLPPVESVVLDPSQPLYCPTLPSLLGSTGGGTEVFRVVVTLLYHSQWSKPLLSVSRVRSGICFCRGVVYGTDQGVSPPPDLNVGFRLPRTVSIGNCRNGHP